METKDFLKFIVESIHTAIVATVDDDGYPFTAAIDMMDYNDNSLFFLTAKGKGFYHRLKNREFLAFTAMKGQDTMSTVAVSVRGKVRELGDELLPALFEKNPYMCDIYPTVESRSALTVFQIYEGTGEWFDLSKSPIERFSFSFGDAQLSREGYYVNNKCIGCHLCYFKCPQKCINISVSPVEIIQSNCLHCGNCFDVCPAGAIDKII